MVFNQSNWRYLIEWTFIYADKVSFNIPSVILQYLEYYRITANVSTDYEDKVAKDARVLGLITAILTRKYEYTQILYLCNEGSYLSVSGEGEHAEWDERRQLGDSKNQEQHGDYYRIGNPVV